MSTAAARPSWWRRWRRRPDETVTYADDGTLAVRGESWDPARADTAVVAAMVERGVDLGRPLLVRHHLRLPGGAAVASARSLLAQDGYATLEVGPAPGPGAGRVLVRASRTQLVTGLSLAQERSRMAGLAQRLQGDVDGWDVLGPDGDGR